MTPVSPQLPALLYPERVADATIRGFLTQAYYSALRWLELGDNELLLCEGDEDIDRYFFNADGSLREMRQEQIEDLSGALSARSESVHQSLFNFLVSFVEHRRQGRRCFFVFVTNAAFANQQVQSQSADADKAGKTKIPLSIDVLRNWSTLASSPSPEDDRAALTASVRALVTGYAVDSPTTTDDGKSTKEKKVVAAAQVKAAIAYLDQEKLWPEFLPSVEWKLEQPSHAALESLLHERFRGDPRTERSPDLLAQRALLRVLQAASRSRVADRLLARAELEALVSATEGELRAWADKHHPERISGWFKALEDELRRELDTVRVKLDRLAAQPHERLRRTSERAIARLERAASLRTPNGPLTIARPVASSMSAMAGSFLVVGDPGAGKSGALHTLVKEFTAAGHEVLVLSADLLPDPDEVLSTLQSWPASAGPRTLIVDALDAARGEIVVARVRAFLEELMRHDYGRRVVASIRTFDLKARSELAELFAGTPDVTHFDRRFASIAHVRVGRLSDTEVGQLKAYASLEAVVGKASSELRDLLRVPFHLSLVSDLLATGTKDLELGKVRTQLDLLSRYWAVRVDQSSETQYAHRALLGRLCDEIVRARAFWADVHNLPALGHLSGLLSNQVLMHPPGAIEEMDQERVGFSHHILFDYACARLWMPKTPEKLAQALRANPDLLLVARPSLDMHLRRLWDADANRAAFWNAVLAIADDKLVSEVGQIVGATITADSATSLNDFKPLLDAASHPPGRAAAARALRHIVESHREMYGRSPHKTTATPWPSLIDAVVGLGHDELCLCVLPLLRDLCAAGPTGEDASLLNRAARRVLAWAKKAGRGREQLVGLATRAICFTFAADPSSSQTALSTLLGAEAIATLGHETLLAIAESALSILSIRPDFVEEVFRVSFRAAFEKPLEEDASVERGGPVMGLVFRRGDMLQAATYRLGKDFPMLLTRDPVRGTRILVDTLRSFKPTFAKEGEPRSFGFRGCTIDMFEDGSVVWDHALRARGESQVQMLDAWEARLVEVCAGQDRTANSAFLDALASEGSLAVLWRRVLRAASKNPTTVGVAGLELLAAPALLTSSSTTTQAGDALRAMFPQVAQQERLRIEQTIVALGDEDEAASRARSVRARLLGCLSLADLVSDAARAAFEAQQREEGGFPKNAPAFQMRTSVEPFDEDKDLRRRGVDLTAPADVPLHAAIQPLRMFLSITDTAQPSGTQVLEAVRAAKRVVSVLTRPAWCRFLAALFRGSQLLHRRVRSRATAG